MTKIWRYMELAKFVDLLNRQELYFARADKFADPFEGATTQNDLLVRQLQMLELEEKAGNKSVKVKFNYQGEWITIDNLEKPSESVRIFERIRKLYFINCWHKSEVESEAMWKLYSQGLHGIAIQTTIDSLVGNIEMRYRDKIVADSVNYINYESGMFDHKNGNSSAFFHKRNHFAYEQEFRLVTPYIICNDNHIDEERQSRLSGIHIPLNNLNDLIHNVYVSPLAEDWFYSVVESIVEKYNLRGQDGKIQKPLKSEMRSTPIY